MTQCTHRGLLNFRRSARWLQEQGLGDHSEEAIVSALRRWEPQGAWLQEDGWELLDTGEVSVKSGWLVFDVPSTYENTQRVNQLQQRLSLGDQNPPMYGRSTIRIAVRQTREHIVRDLVGMENVDREFHDVVRIGLHRNGEDFPLPLGTSIAMGAFGAESINVLGTHNMDDERFVLVSRSDARNAYHVASDIMRT